jgi:hypothetical protein
MFHSIFSNNYRDKSSLPIFVPIMKKVVLLLLLSFISFCSVSGQEFFCTNIGQQFKYVRRYADGGDIKWTHTMKINSVDRLADGEIKVNYTSNVVNRKDKQLFNRPIEMNVLIDKNGDVTMDIAGTATAVFQSMFPKSLIKSSGGQTTLPSSMKKGNILPDVNAKVSVFGVKYSIDVTKRIVIGTETIKTPAGTFDCVIVKEQKVEKAPAYSRITTSYTWYCRGIGFVRHDTYDENMKLDTREMLESIYD